MKPLKLVSLLSLLVGSAHAKTQLQEELIQLKKQSHHMQYKIHQLEAKVAAQNQRKVSKSHDASRTKQKPINKKSKKNHYRDQVLTIHGSKHPESKSFYPVALLANDAVITYIAGTPVVTSPYMGDRPAFDGSDYIVNISSINRDIRLMQQRRRLYESYAQMDYPLPYHPIIALSGKAEPVANYSRLFGERGTGDINLGSAEVDVAAMLNPNVEAFIGLGYDDAPPYWGGPRVNNSSFNLNLGFINIGNLDVTPWYFTAGQIYLPFGRYSSAMVSSPLTTSVARVKARPFILGYKSQQSSGPYAAVYAFRSETTLGHVGVGGVNAGYTIERGNVTGDLGGGWIASMNDAMGMQINGAETGYFGGFSSATNGNEAVNKVPGVNVHGNISFDRYNLTAEWVGASHAFRSQDLSFNGRGAQPQAGQLEASMTFKAFDKPASIGLGYQWTREALALNLPKERFSGVFNISIWKDTVESLEYRHEKDYGQYQFANGAAPFDLFNLNIIGTGKTADTILAQIGVYF